MKLRRCFCQNQLISKKKSLHQNLCALQKKQLHFSDPNNSKSFTTFVPQLRWGGCFHFWSKFWPQKTKNVLFCLLFRPLEGATAPLHMDTLLLYFITAVLLSHLMSGHFFCAWSIISVERLNQENLWFR